MNTVPARFHFRHRRLVEFADTDLAGLVHFSNFLRYVEAAEHAFFRSLGFSIHQSNGPEHHGWPRLEVTCRYFKPARFEQTLEICLHIDELRTSSLRYSFWIFIADAPDRTPIAAGSCSIIHVELDTHTREIRKAAMPPQLRQRFEEAMSRAAGGLETPHVALTSAAAEGSRVEGAG